MGSNQVVSEGDNVDGTVTRVLRNCDDSPYGLLVDIGFSAFVPRSLVPIGQRDGLNALVGQWMTGVVVKVEEKRRNVVIAPEYFGEYIPPPKSTDITITDDYLQVLLDDLREIVPTDDCHRYLGFESAKNILIAIVGEDCGDDADEWERLIRSRRLRN